MSKPSLLVGQKIGFNSSLIAEYEKNLLLHPKKNAINYNKKNLSFSDFDSLVNIIANELEESEFEYVFIVTERSIWIPVFFWACCKANKVYAPIDSSLPKERIQTMIQGVEGSIVFADREDLEISSISVSLDKYIVEEMIAHHSTYQVKIESLQDKLFLLYTSGTTGTPKGILGTRSGLLNRMMWMKNEFEIDSSDVIMYKTPISFDVHLWEIIVPFITGARLFILPANEHKLVNRMIKRVISEEITRIHFVPSVFRMFCKFVKDSDALTLKSIFSSGEALQVADVEIFKEMLSNIDLINLYGPAEASVDVTYFIINEDEKYLTIPIGKPIANISILILNDNLELAEIGEEGEIYLVGVGLARGYTNDKLTSEKFLACPHVCGQRMYRTGDIGKVDANGNLLYLGRTDSQVKVGGVRIELSEVEHQILKISEVSDAAVIFDKDLSQIKAFIVTDINPDNIKKELERVLPVTYIPSIFHILESIPISNNGKRDIKKLLKLQSK